jgi:hypothetical protein
MRRVAVVAIAMLGVAGCASTSTFESWRGRNIEDLQFAWGPPDRTSRLSDGRSMVVYEHSHFIQGTSYQCTVTFFANSNGTIVDSNASGNIGGCNAMLRSKPAAK